MDFLRSKELKDAFQMTHQIFSCSDLQQTANATIDPVISHMHTMPNAEVRANVLQDIHILPWLKQQAHLLGSQTLIQEMIQCPLQDPAALQLRQQWIRQQPNVGKIFHELAPLEENVLWALRLPDINTAWPMPILFPCWPVVSLINRIPWVLEFYQIYRLYLAPAMNLIYPMSIFFGPWWYLRTKLKWNISLPTYTGFLIKILKELFKIDKANLQQSLIRIVTFTAYIVVYIYTIVQSIDIAMMLHKVRRQLQAKLADICKFVTTAESVLKNIPAHFFQHFGIDAVRPTDHPKFSNNMTTMYRIWTSPPHRTYLAHLLQKLYVLDTISVARSWVETRKWTFANMNPQSPLEMHKMKNPILDKGQRSNPIRLSKNLIVTGPNAAGKTTYVKSVLTNILLSQTFGVVFAAKCTTPLFHSILSFMRVHDEVGRESLFEAEVNRCLNAIHEVQAAAESTKDYRAIILLDEPMHSTPPIEGAASAMAFMNQIAQIPGVHTITTTHFFPITKLEQTFPAIFANISFDAQTSEKNKKVIFSYKIRKGPSFQCIALELLRQKQFPKAFILDAIKFKNKICQIDVNDS